MQDPNESTPASLQDVSKPVIPPNQTIEQLENTQPKTITGSSNGDRKPPRDTFSKYLILEGWSHWFFRLGFASIFFVNAIYAAIEPKSFTDLLVANPIANSLGHADLMVKIAMVNDLLLSILIVGGWRKQLVYSWAGGWLLLVAGIKIINLVV